MDLQGKVAIVTGGGTGIGKAISQALAAAGADVAVNYSRSEADATATAHELEAAGVRALPVQADISRSGDVSAMVDRVVHELGRLDVLVNNAGFTKFVPMRDLEGMDEKTWERVFQVNVKGAWLCAKAVAPAMRQQGEGAIVNVASVAGLRVTGSSMAYAVSKAAMIHLTKCLALALSPEIRVNAVAPGLVVTRWWNHADEQFLAARRADAPLKRSVAPEEVATVALELIRNPSTTGQTVAIDAGTLL
ncbi:MAG: glucose 1-dehydrogenase [Chloroflexi bacterium]|nr:glucose 1-dehydrogenase [Chloroflexota bacterium]